MISLILDNLDDIQFGARTFNAAPLPFNECTITGLPLTHNSIKIIGLFQRLKALSHPNLCAYLDGQRRKSEKVIVVSEHYIQSLADEDIRHIFKSPSKMKWLAFQALHALTYLNSQGMVHRCINPSSFKITKNSNLKISNYGLYHMTNSGSYVCFPIGDPPYMAPEVLAAGPANGNAPLGFSSDVWSLGVILLEVALMTYFFSECSLEETLESILKLALLDTGTQVMESLADRAKVSDRLKSLPGDLLQFLDQCLTPSNRPNPADLLHHPFLAGCKMDLQMDTGFLSTQLRSLFLELTPNPKSLGNDLALRNLHEIYYLWRITSHDLKTDLQRHGLMTYNPPIITVPSLICQGGEDYPKLKDRTSLYHDMDVPLTFHLLKQNLLNSSVKPCIPSYLHMVMENEEGGCKLDLPLKDIKEYLPPVILENNVDHQLGRFLVFERLLSSYPFTQPLVVMEAQQDIPPLYRAHIWAALLQVSGDIQENYDLIDKVTPSDTDRQIEVDIPRCHQYDELLSSPQGHATFKRVLKAWLDTHPRYVYWQGLDSLSAPFIRLNFNNEALAFACLQAFIDKYLNNFFLKDNSAVIQEYLAVFSHLLAYHDVELYNHLANIGFFPELYAIPWFLTMYTHVFPLDKIYHLWDTLLLGSSSFPLFIGLAILRQLRSDLLSFSFNDCILMFSDLPDIVISTCTQDAITLYNNTPPSASFCRSALKSNKNLSYSGNTQRPEEEMVTIADLKKETSPRITYTDLTELLSNSSKEKVLVIDVRPYTQYQQGTLPSALHLPLEAAGADGLSPSPEASCLAAHRGDLVVVVGSQANNDSAKFAAQLVGWNYPKVCILAGGTEPLRRGHQLVYPTL